LNRVGYTGQRRDEETGLMALGNGERYYSPNLGQFVQQDSFAGLLDQPQMLNRHSYVTNNPTGYSDPSGHEPKSDFDKVIDILSRATRDDRSKRPGVQVIGEPLLRLEGVRAFGALVGMALNAGRQYIAISEGGQKGWDWDQLEDAAYQGAEWGAVIALLEVSGVGGPVILALEVYFAIEGVRSGLKEIGEGHPLTGWYDILTGILPLGKRAFRAARGGARPGAIREGMREPGARQEAIAGGRREIGGGGRARFLGQEEGPAVDLMVDGRRADAARSLGRYNSAGERIAGRNASREVSLLGREQLEYFQRVGEREWAEGTRRLREGEGGPYEVLGMADDLAAREGPITDPSRLIGPKGNPGGQRVLFGQKRVGPKFGEEGRPPEIAGRLISDVAADLRAGRISPDVLAIEAFEYQGQLVSANTRSLSALSEAGLRPTNITRINPSRELLRRLREKPLIPNAPLPGPRVPVTPSQRDLRIRRIIEIP
jgi:RHS repeat-associated protein